MMEKIEAFVKKYGMIQSKDTVVTGVSGGADSICLLFALLELRKKLDFELAVCHVNHQIRGKSADEDEAFVRRLCEERGIPFWAFHENVELIAAKRKQSLEAAGRMVRREAFETVRREVGGTKIATAHHQNDSAETLLMNLARGAGLKGMCAIRPVNGIWIRPLLCLERREIEAWLKEQNLPYCQDETNNEDEYMRNRVRHRIIPELEKQVNTRAVRHFCETAGQVQEVWDYLEAQTQEAFADCAQRVKRIEGMCAVQEPGSDAAEDSAAEPYRELTAAEPERTGTEIFIDYDKFAALPPVIGKLVIKKALETAAGAEKDIAACHVETVLDLFAGQTGRRADLPYRLTAERTYTGVCIGPKREAQRADGYAKELAVPGETRVAEKHWNVICRVFEKKAAFSFAQIPQKTYTKWFDYDIIKNSLFIRTRRQGDSITIDNTGSRQKLKKYFINEKVPAAMREELLVIADGEQILWIPGMRQSHAYQVREDTKRILEIRITEEKTDV